MGKRLINNNILSFSLIFVLFHYLNICKMGSVMAQNSNTTVGVKVGVILDMDTWLGKIGLSCIKMALDDFYASHSNYKTRILLYPRNVPSYDIVAAASAAIDLLKNVQVQAIIGPSTSMESNFLVDLGNKAKVPIISFSATSPYLSSIRTPYFIRATQNDSSQVQAISAIVQAFGWRNVVPIYVGDDFGHGIIPFLYDAFQDINVQVPYRSVIPHSATDDQIVAELYKLMTMQTRVFVVHMWLNHGSRLLSKAKEVGMMEKGYVWIITDGLANLLSMMDPSIIDSMQGVLGVRTYVPLTKQREKFTIRWKKKFQLENPSALDVEMDVFGLWAYDATTALVTAVENVGSTNFGFVKSNVFRNSTDLESIGFSTSGPKLLYALTRTSFKGLSGNFCIVEGQLQSSVYELINVVNKGGRRIAFWTKRYGLTKFLNFSNIIEYSTSKENLGAIIWAGDTICPPKGWVDSTYEKKMKIGVPVKDSSNKFVRITRNPDGKTTINGYCIAVFDAVIAALPYDVYYDYIPFEKNDGTPRGTYNDLVYQVYTGEYDAVVGDISITANRANYVDFTVPYIESGVSLIVPTKYNKRKNTWVFLKPFTWDLWVTSICSFIFVGFLIWILEHGINEDFHRAPSNQIGIIFYFAFPTMVFARKDKVSNLARFVLIILGLVTWFMLQCYTANLASMLTVQQLQPVAIDMKVLLKNRENVGYQQGSMALDLLKGLGFVETNLKVYDSIEECHALFSNGSIIAAFDGIPFARLFVEKYCLKYTTIGPTYKNDGFGFVFPKGSKLVSDVSRAILNVTEGETMAYIEKVWLNEKSNCPDDSNTFQLNSLGVESFLGLFIILLFVAISTLLVHIFIFFYQHWDILSDLEPQTTLWQKIMIVRRNGVQDRVDLVDPLAEAICLPNNNGPQITSSTLNIIDDNFVFHGDQCTISMDSKTQAVIVSEI